MTAPKTITSSQLLTLSIFAGLESQGVVSAHMTGPQVLAAMRRDDAVFLLDGMVLPGECGRLPALFRLIHNNNGLGLFKPDSPIEKARTNLSQSVMTRYFEEINALDLVDASAEELEATFAHYYFSKLADALETGAGDIFFSPVLWGDFKKKSQSFEGELGKLWEEALRTVFERRYPLDKAVKKIAPFKIGDFRALTQFADVVCDQMGKVWIGLENLKEEASALHYHMELCLDLDPVELRRELTPLRERCRRFEANIAKLPKDAENLKSLSALIPLESEQKRRQDPAQPDEFFFKAEKDILEASLIAVRVNLSGLGDILLKKENEARLREDQAEVPQVDLDMIFARLAKKGLPWLGQLQYKIEEFKQGSVLVIGNQTHIIDQKTAAKIETWRLSDRSQAIQVRDLFDNLHDLQGWGISLVAISDLPPEHSLKKAMRDIKAKGSAPQSPQSATS